MVRTMTRQTILRGALGALLVGLAWWAVVSLAIGGGEPWDAAGYWTWAYPGALACSLLLGLAWPQRAWLWGPLVVLAQVPVVVAVSGLGPLLAAGLVYAALLSIPAAVASWAGGRLRRRRVGHRADP